MKFTRANIYGFGKWVDKEIYFNENELNIIYGENESGKTTLQKFIMFILFGQTAKEQTAHQPIESSKFGGILTFLDANNQEVTVERTKELLTIYSPTETSNEEKVLTSYLNGLTKQTFMSIYSFSAVDLLQIRDITEQEFGNILFNVGLAGATNIEIAERNIERETGKLFKKTGRIPTLNKQLTKLEELVTIEQKLKKQESYYAEMKEKQKSKKVKLQNLIEKIKATRIEADFISKQRHLLPAINELKSTKEELQKFPETLDFPEAGIKRLEKYKESLIPLLSNQASIEKNMLNYKEELEKLKKSILSKEMYDLASNLQKDRNNYEHYLVESEELTRTLEKTANEIELGLNDLAIPLNIESFKDLSLPYYLAKTWKSIEEEALQLSQIRKEIESEQLMLENELEMIERETNQLKHKLLPLEELDKLKEQLINYTQSTKQTTQFNEHKINQSTKKKIVQAGLGVVTLLVILFFITTSSLFIYSSIGIAIIIASLYYVVNYFEKKNEQLIHSLVANQSSSLTKDEYIKIKKQVEKQDDYLMQIKFLENEKQKITREQLQINERSEMFNQRENIFNERVLDERKEYDFLNNIDPIHWTELLTILKQLKEKETYLTEKELKNTQVNEILNAYEQRLSNILNNLSIMNYEQLVAHIEAHKKADQLIDNYKEIIDKLRDEKSLLDEKINYYQAEITALFKLASVENEEAYIEKYYKSEEKNRLNEQLSSYYSQLETSFDLATINQLLQINQDDYDLDQKNNELKIKISQYDKEIEEVRTKLATLEAELSQMEETEEYSNVFHKVTHKKARAKELAFEWAAMKLATDTLEATKRSFHQKYMKDVIKKASSYFKIITKSKYIAIYPPEEGKPFSVETNIHTRFVIDQLSQGTIDQLYVSLRIAISSVMSEKYSVPFLIDDAFVHFDHKREKAIMLLLKEITKEQQVILFTCKKHLLELTDGKVLDLTNQ